MELKQGKLEQHRWSFMTLAKFEDPKVIVTVEGIRSERTLNQLAYYWGIILPLIAEHTGHSTPDLHEIFKRLYLPPKLVKWRGRDIKMPNTTKELSKGEMVEYIERVIAEAAQLGIVVPPADPSKSTRRLDI